jgi:hypothetical protein
MTGRRVEGTVRGDLAAQNYALEPESEREGAQDYALDLEPDLLEEATVTISRLENSHRPTPYRDRYAVLLAQLKAATPTPYRDAAQRRLEELRPRLSDEESRALDSYLTANGIWPDAIGEVRVDGVTYRRPWA